MGERCWTEQKGGSIGYGAGGVARHTSFRNGGSSGSHDKGWQRFRVAWNGGDTSMAPLPLLGEWLGGRAATVE